jgi:dolichyl-phosphate-mannose-protein mannosyltransferase
VATTTHAETPPAIATTPVDAVRRRLVAPMPTDVVAGWVASLAVFAVALLLRLYRLGLPAKDAFDEVYYRKDSYDLWKYGVELNNEHNGPGYIVHPPVGKWMLGFGQWVTGLDRSYVKDLQSSHEAFGWRLSAALVGALSVLILCRLGRRLFRSTMLGCFAGLLMTVDGLHFVQSRMAMLDIFLLFWILAAAACLAADRDDLRARLAAGLGDPSAPYAHTGRLRPWRLAAGVCLGLAVGTKWSAVFFLVVCVALSYAWEVGARRTAGARAPASVAFARSALPIVIALAVVPVLVYVGSWAGWFLTDDGWRRVCVENPPWGGQAHPERCGPFWGWIQYHLDILSFHNDLTSKHPYQSHPLGWLLLARPVSYWYTTPRPGTSREVLGIGTPALWWASVPALLACGWRWVSRRDWRAAFILAGFAASFVPWLVYDVERRTMFLFYALPLVPFMCLALAFCAGLVLGPREAHPERRFWGGAAVGSYALVVIANFVWLYPILAAVIIPYGSWQRRMLFSSWI